MSQGPKPAKGSVSASSMAKAFYLIFCLSVTGDLFIIIITIIVSFQLQQWFPQSLYIFLANLMIGVVHSSCTPRTSTFEAY